MAALATGDTIFQELAVEKANRGERLQGLQIHGLPAAFVFRPLHDGGEVLRDDERLVGPQQLPDQIWNVEPVEALPAFRAQAVIQVVAIDVGNDALR